MIRLLAVAIVMLPFHSFSQELSLEKLQVTATREERKEKDIKKHAATYQKNISGRRRIYPAPPRTYTVRVSYKF